MLVGAEEYEHPQTSGSRSCCELAKELMLADGNYSFIELMANYLKIAFYIFLYS